MDTLKKTHNPLTFILTVDTEADNQWKWSAGQPFTLHNMEHAPRFQSLCEKYGIIPTYLITYEVATHTESAGLLRSWQDRGAAEIGAHMHPWSNPPFDSREAQLSHKSFPSELPSDIFTLKLETLTREIAQAMGRVPTSFRAGRWGFSMDMVPALQSLGYIVDTSITPKINWNEEIVGNTGNLPDFSKESVYPRVLTEGLVEVPMSIFYTGQLGREGSFFHKWFAGRKKTLFQRAAQKFLFKLKWCRIFPQTNLQDLIGLYEKAEKNNVPVLQFMIHSSEFTKGGSPYTKKDSDVDHMFSLLEEFFMFLKAKRVVSCGLTKYAVLLRDAESKTSLI